MPRNGRCVEPDLAYHVTQRGSNKQRVFYCSTDYKRYLKLLAAEFADAEARVLGYCLMTNHIHMVVVPKRPDSLAVLFQRVHGRYAQCLNISRGRSGHLWQQRYFSCPLSESHLWWALRYVERNPCRAQLVGRPEEYRWSSAAAHLAEEPNRAAELGGQFLDLDFWNQKGGAENWRELLAGVDEPEKAYLLRRCTYAGRPFGDEEFLKQFEARFQRVWRRWGFEAKAHGA
jgi:putative transposase